jgi:hypothetical protein
MSGKWRGVSLNHGSAQVAWHSESSTLRLFLRSCNNRLHFQLWADNRGLLFLISCISIHGSIESKILTALLHDSVLALCYGRSGQGTQIE